MSCVSNSIDPSEFEHKNSKATREKKSFTFSRSGTVLLLHIHSRRLEPEPEIKGKKFTIGKKTTGWLKKWKGKRREEEKQKKTRNRIFCQNDGGP